MVIAPSRVLGGPDTFEGMKPRWVIPNLNAGHDILVLSYRALLNGHSLGDVESFRLLDGLWQNELMVG